LAGAADPLPWGSGGGLDVDLLDGKHASEVGFTDPYYVLTKAYPQLVNSRIHPNTGDPNYDVKHEFTDITGVITDVQHGSRGSGLHADSHARLHDHSLAADGSPIAVAGVPDLPASKITSLRFPMARMPDGILNYLLLGQGAGVDPAYGAFSDTIHGSRGSGLHTDSHARLHALDSALDHSGVITDAQHGTKTTIPNAHHDRDHFLRHAFVFGDVTIADKYGGVETPNILDACRFQLTKACDVKRIFLYMSPLASGKLFKCGIYGDDNGAPSALKGVTGEVSASVFFSWWAFEFATPISLSPGWYWLAWLSNYSHSYYYKVGATNQMAWVASTYPTFPDPFGTPSYFNREVAIYAFAEGEDPLTFAQLNGIVAFDLEVHAPRHHSGGADPLALASIAGIITDAQHGTRGSGLHADSHARLHALDSALDHSGVITDAQHGSRGSGLHADSHARLHALDSALDHSGVITDVQHGAKTTIPNAHHVRSHDHSLALDGSPIAVAGVPNLPASKITSERFGMPRMPDGTSGYVLTAQGAGVDPIYAALPTIGKGIKASLTSSQSIPDTTVTRINLGTEVFDDYGEFDPVNYIFVPQVSGRYFIALGLVYSTMTDGAEVRAYFSRVTEGEYAILLTFYCRPSLPTAGIMNIVGCTTYNLVAGKQYAFETWQNSGSARSLLAGERYTWMTVFRLW